MTKPTTNAEKDAELNRIARDICDSEPFMWLMVGANHTEAHLSVLREVWSKHYTKLGGGYGARAKRVLPPGQCPGTRFPDGTHCGEYNWHASDCPARVTPPGMPTDATLAHDDEV